LSDTELDKVYCNNLESIFNEPVEDSEILGVLPYVRGFILKESLLRAQIDFQIGYLTYMLQK
jgi:hypothetical protein